MILLETAHKRFARGLFRFPQLLSEIFYLSIESRLRIIINAQSVPVCKMSPILSLAQEGNKKESNLNDQLDR